MTRSTRYLAALAGALLLISPLAVSAQRTPQNQNHPEAGATFLETEMADPELGNVIAHLAPVGEASDEALGRATFSYNRGRGITVAEFEVEGLRPNWTYQIHVAIHNVKPVADLGTFETDENGNGQFRAELVGAPEFNLINVRVPAWSGSRVLTSWAGDGGKLLQVVHGGR